MAYFFELFCAYSKNLQTNYVLLQLDNELLTIYMVKIGDEFNQF